MESFPAEFADLLSRRGRRILERGDARTEATFRDYGTPIAILRQVLDTATADACCRLLDREMYAHVRQVRTPIPPETIWAMERNYEEQLPKTLRFKTAYFASRSALSYRAARRIGLFDMMRSESFARFAEAVTGARLERGNGVQLILYEQGDYVGPHNDHHPEVEAAREGFVDVHLMLSNDAVADQWLICEEHGLLNRAYDVAPSGSAAVYRLPFWHYTTPLRAKRGREHEARRWLLLGSFMIDRSGSEPRRR